MSSQVDEIIANRSHAIASAFARVSTIQVQVEEAEALKRLAYARESINVEEEADPQQLGQLRKKNVVYVESKTDPDLDSSVWVAASYDDYKKAFVRFVDKTYGIVVQKNDLKRYDVDHLLNRARSPSDDTLIRIEATPSDVNQAWGRLFEKVSSNPSFYANTHRKRRTMSYMICAKLAGEMPPMGPTDAASISRLANYFAGIGIQRADAQKGLESMLAFAYKIR